MLVEIKKHQFYFAMCFAFLLLEALFSNNTQAVFYILSIATLIGGVPHGALDFFILRRIFNNKSFYLSLASYLLLSIAVFMIFNMFPIAFFLLFLFYSAIHFGDSDWEEHHIASKIGWGLSVISIPALIDPQGISYFYSIFTDQNTGSSITTTMIYLSVISILLTISFEADRYIKVVVLLAFAITSYLTNIYFGFASYFVAFHSYHHMQYWKRKVGRHTFTILFFITLSVVSVFALQLLFQFIPINRTGLQFEEEMIYTVFLIIGALTVPHMLLVSYAKYLSVDDM